MIQTERTDAEVERLIEGVDRLVWQLAGRAMRTMPVYVQTWMDVEDLYCEAMVALVPKARIWDPERSRFTTYAYTVVWSHFYKFRQKWMASKRDSGPLISLDAPSFVEELAGVESAQRDVPADLRTDIPVNQTCGSEGYDDCLVMDAIVSEWFDVTAAEV